MPSAIDAESLGIENPREFFRHDQAALAWAASGQSGLPGGEKTPSLLILILISLKKFHAEVACLSFVLGSPARHGDFRPRFSQSRCHAALAPGLLRLGGACLLCRCRLSRPEAWRRGESAGYRNEGRLLFPSPPRHGHGEGKLRTWSRVLFTQ